MFNYVITFLERWDNMKNELDLIFNQMIEYINYIKVEAVVKMKLNKSDN